MIKIYNTLSGKKEVFSHKKDKRVDLFVCGITPYDFSHIGHARTYVVFDVIAKYLKYRKYNVFYLQNITDIDDKIINKAEEQKTTPQKLARFFEKEYLKDMQDLKVNNVTKYARATDHIEQIISQVKRLLEKGFAYRLEDGIYYDISKFKDYGKLSKRTLLQAEDAVSRIDEAKKKRNAGDFSLWKLSKPGEPKWKSPLGLGRPGWHIEDTAITEEYFGPQYDMHGGGRDLMFPHHEAEIAQMEAISGKKPMVKYWLHPGFLTVDGQKMAKSLGNFVTIKDFLEEHSPRLLRLIIISTHWQSPIDWNKKAILQAEKNLLRVDEFTKKLRGVKRSKGGEQNLAVAAQKDFEKAMDDNFNTPVALAAMFQLITKGNALIDKEEFSRNEAKRILDFLKKADEVFKFIFPTKKETGIPSSIQKLVKEREQAREEKNWQGADKIRRKIQELGWIIEDTKEGPKTKRRL